MKLTGSWTAMPTPFTEDNTIDYEGFQTLIDRQIKYGTSELFILGSCGETTLLTLDEKRQIVKEVIQMTKGRIPTFFNASMLTTELTCEFAGYCEEQGADGVIFSVPTYTLIPQAAVFQFFDKVMGSIHIPCGIYNNPSRLGVNVEPKTIRRLSDLHSNFIVMKEAMGSSQQLVQDKRLCGDKLSILCCDYPHYSIVIPTLAIGGNGTANIGANIMPEEVAKYSREWTSMEIVEECRETYFKYYPVLEALYQFSNPICVKAALRELGLPGGHLREPYQELTGAKLENLIAAMKETGLYDKYHV